MSKQKQYLFIFTIGPVQSFIAQARKTQDLYAGSQILSQLVKAGMELFDIAEIIFPKILKESHAVPNRFMAIVQGDDRSILEGLAQKVKNKVSAKFTEIAEKSFATAKIKGDKRPKGFDEQINRHLETHWVFYPIGENYKEDYQAAEAALGSVKNIRPFLQLGGDEGEAGRKCNLDGENNALFFGREQPHLAIKSQKADVAVLHDFKMDPKEGLGAVSFVKRYFPDSESFPSTAQIALMSDEEKLSEDDKELLSCYKELFKKETAPDACVKMLNKEWINKVKIQNFKNNENWNTNFDYQLIFEENLIEKNIPDKEQLRLVKILQKRLQSKLKTKYYALVMFDGDKMGKWLSENASLDFHPKFSSLLGKFAKEAESTVNKHGQTVYAGGDDFLGFVNLNYLFEVMISLRDKFKETVSDGLKKEGVDKSFTFSAGIVIAHYKMPLSEVLTTVRKVEKKAKNDGDRNAFCITAMKHSGEIQEAVFKWGDDNANWKALKYITTQLGNRTFSNKFITNLALELYQLGGLALNTIGEKGDDIIATEIKRLLKRALIDRSEDENLKINLMYDKLMILYHNRTPNPTPNPTLEDTFRSIENYIHALQMTDFLSRKTTTK